MKSLLRFLTVVVFALPTVSRADSFPVRVTVTPSQALGPVAPIWNWFGYDELNYTCLPQGASLLASLAQMGGPPVFIRAHHLFTSGDGTPALKFGSTGMYREDDFGRPVYEFAIADRIVDTWVGLGLKPLMQMGFMPEALSSRPQGYPKNPKTTDIVWFGGAFSQPPKDYQKWGDLCYEWTRHCVQRYGEAEAASWRWQVWNEPNFDYWKGTQEEFFKLYDYATEGIRRALPGAVIGGPHTSDGLPPHFAEPFFEHCLRGRNHATGRVGAPLDFIAFHAKGKPHSEKEQVFMGIQAQLNDIAKAFTLISRYPELREKPVIIGESDPDGGAALIKPELGYRNLPHYASYTAASFLRKSDLAAQHRIQLRGAVTWAFEFEHAPWFSGQRQLTTRGVDLPIRHVFRMFDHLRGERVAAQSDAQLNLDEITRRGVREKADVGVFASRENEQLKVLLWHYHDATAAGSDARVSLKIGALGGRLPSVCRQTRIDAEHGNAFAVWKAMGAPAEPSARQIEQIRKAAAACAADALPLQAVGDAATLVVVLPRQSVVLLELEP